MAAVRGKAPIGSAPWLVQERRQADELVDMEVEEFGYSVRNEMEWLNEHMGEIFSNANLNVADVFKTPGKLRGKTPRTARKRNALGERAPLTDIFAPNSQSKASPVKSQFLKQVEKIQAHNDENDENQPQAIAESSKRALPRSKENWDSGYHGMTDDEMEIERIQATLPSVPSPPRQAELVVVIEKPLPAAPRRTTDETFVSAKSNQASRAASREVLTEDETSTIPDETAMPAEQERQAEIAEAVEQQVLTEAAEQAVEDDAERMDADDVRSPSDASSPVKPLLRKSSFTFSALPSREPLAQKKSMGARSSVLNQARSSVLGRFTGGKSLGGQLSSTAADQPDADADAMEVDAAVKPALAREESETTRNHNHSTTQRLQDRINMLGQARDMRTSKSIPNLNASTNQSMYPQIPQAQLDKSEGETARPTTAPAPKQPAAVVEDEEDDWIQPLAKETSRPGLFRTKTAESNQSSVAAQELPVQQESPKRMFSPSRPKLPFGHKKAVSSSAITSPTRANMAPDANHQKAISVSNPAVQTGNESTTPAGSPRRNQNHFDGAVSATKSKLYSALRSAKNIFASSAGVSAQAKLEALSPMPKARQQEDYFGDADAAITYPNIGGQSRVTSAESAASAATASTDRRTRSSTEREQKKKDEETRQMRRAEDGLQKAREQERQRAAAAASKLQKSPSKEYMHAPRPPPSRTETEQSRTTEPETADEMPPPPPPKSMLPTQSQRLREPRRIAKPSKEPLNKSKPAPVTIRMHVPSQLGHRPGTAAQSTAALSQSLNESLPPAVPPKPTLASKASTTSLHSSASHGTLRGGNPSQTAKKALEAAAKKKEADARAAQKKAERQREIEQRRQAKLEEERRKQEEERRRAEEEKRAEQRRRQQEQQRREEAKRQAELKRMEQERAEQQRLEQQRLEQQRLEQQRREQQRAQNEGFSYALKQERTQGQQRGDMAGARPISRMMQHQINPAKPPKRALQEEDENHRPGMHRNPPSYQQLDAKRRKTNEDDEEPQEPRRSVITVPPVRQSAIRGTTKFPHGYGPAPGTTQHSTTMFKQAVTNQHHQQLHGARPNDMTKFQNGRIPFADAPNPPGASAANPHKTPGRPMLTAHGMKSAAKSSPHYPNGENIDLPEIQTDSEDDDSENEFQAPSWTESPALRQLLVDQQARDPFQVFGPIAPIRMEEVFKNEKRAKKFRDRTSSANWNSGDKLTEEERIKDREMRERMIRDGGWTFQPGN